MKMTPPITFDVITMANTYKVWKKCSSKLAIKMSIYTNLIIGIENFRRSRGDIYAISFLLIIPYAFLAIIGLVIPYIFNVFAPIWCILFGIILAIEVTKYREIKHTLIQFCHINLRMNDSFVIFPMKLNWAALDKVVKSKGRIKSLSYERFEDWEPSLTKIISEEDLDKLITGG
ncbi:MAG: hypothetical protein KAS32_29975 [Candidatus Peribacteraceae bacterium]|nr:hypothetical protein [Candidatus Peribacteraceae bacterium]